MSKKTKQLLDEIDNFLTQIKNHPDDRKRALLYLSKLDQLKTENSIKLKNIKI